uniref:CDC42 effector protein 2 n=1 Tax=Dromaius novaehollandiae TaxID=8790 RepID=A0A8C4KD31_DRONO
MSAKVPIYLKRGSRKGKKEKLRDLLSSDMISPPLGDFRHTIHVGSGGEREAAPPFPVPAGSLLSLHVDLGPSILDDVLRVMEKHRDGGGGAGRQLLT